ncbi:MAG TPA: class I SAM-dependent methyltransferase [Patescibacteria group bacterium]|nr:class I SAM-dependent methyltransferase [Patescibacteria group bacterium]
MLDLFKRQGQKPPSGSGGSDSPQRSHIFPKFLKRLAARGRPLVLDFGRLSGENIEIFARLGCRVQVEDLIALASEKTSAPGSDRAVALPSIGEADTPSAEAAAAESVPGAPTGPPADARSTAPGPGATPVAAAPATPASGVTRSGATPARPSRHIVLPPRVFARQAGAPTGARPVDRSAERTPLATRFAYDDESFDGIVAWDLFNYYDAESGRAMAADIARILKPGGLVFAYFHARTLGVPPGPGRYRIVDEARIDSEPFSGKPMPHHVFQNRDIEKMFTGMRIAELYFLKSGVREMMLEKRPGVAVPSPPVAKPRSRFRID